MKKKSALIIMAMFAVVAHAADVKWTGGGDGISWNDPNNWDGSVESPSEINLVVTASGSATMDLGGETVSIGTWGNADVPITLRNGTLILENGATGLQGENKKMSEKGLWDSGQFLEKYTTPFILEENAHLIVRTKFNVGNNRDGGYQFIVNSGTSLELNNVSMVDRLSFIKALPGGKVSITCNSADQVQKGQNSTARSTWANDGGEFSFPNGFVLKKKNGTYSGWGARASFRIQQNSGKMVLGGPISLGNYSSDTSVNKDNNATGLYFQWYGGEIVVTDDVSFNCLSYFSSTSDGVKFENYTGIFADSVVTANVEVAKTMDLSESGGVSGLPIRGSGVDMTKKGLGTLIMGATAPAQMSVEEGSVKFANGSIVQDASWLTFADGAVMYLDGVSAIDTAPNGTPVYAYADYSAIAINSVLISSSDSALLAAIKSSILASGDFPSTVSLEISDGALVVTSNYTFNHGTIQDLNDPNGWQCGFVPEGEDVSVSGANVTAILNAQTPVFNSISVANGATLKVEGEVTLPSIKLAADAKLVICSDAVVLASEIAPKAGETGMSVLKIESGAVLQVNESAVYFRDIDLRLNGTIENKAANANIYFGYAPANEQTMFAMTSDGGKLINGTSASIDCVYFMSADIGGVVSLPASSEILIKDTTLPQTCYKFCEGNGNTEEIPFSIIGTKIKVSASGHHKFAGTAKVTFGEGSYFKKPDASGPQGEVTVFNFEDSAKVILDAGSYLYLPVCGNWSGAGVRFSPTKANWECLTINEGAYAYIFNDYWSNDKAVVVMNGGAWEMRYRAWWNSSRHQIVFRGVRNVSVPENKACHIRRAEGTGVQANETHYNGNAMTNAVDSATKFTGAGDLCVTNGYNGKIFAAVVQSSGNTCTGSAYGDLASKATLLFNNGSDWAGKVIFDGSVALVNGALNSSYFAASDAPTEVTFGSVDLKTDFPIRVFGTYDEDLKKSTITGNDKVNITGNEGWIDNGGQLTVQLPENFSVDALPLDARIELGTIPVGAPLPKVQRSSHLKLYTEPIDGDEEHLIYGLKPNRGFQIIFR